MVGWECVAGRGEEGEVRKACKRRRLCVCVCVLQVLCASTHAIMYARDLARTGCGGYVEECPADSVAGGLKALHEQDADLQQPGGQRQGGRQGRHRQ